MKKEEKRNKKYKQSADYIREERVFQKKY